MLISPEELEQNRLMHEKYDSYGVSGRKRANIVTVLANSYSVGTILDYGCGKGTLRQAIEGGKDRVREYDPAIYGKHARPDPAELVVCNDVLEHVPKEHVETVVSDLSQLTLKVCLIIISLLPARKVRPDGKNAHITLERTKWWYDIIDRYFHVREMRDEKREALFVGVVRQYMAEEIAKADAAFKQAQELSAANDKRIVVPEPPKIRTLN